MCLSFLHLICLLERDAKICNGEGKNDFSIFKSHFDILGDAEYSLKKTKSQVVVLLKIIFLFVIENTSLYIKAVKLL